MHLQWPSCSWSPCFLYISQGHHLALSLLCALVYALSPFCNALVLHSGKCLSTTPFHVLFLTPLIILVSLYPLCTFTLFWSMLSSFACISFVVPSFPVRVSASWGSREHFLLFLFKKYLLIWERERNTLLFHLFMHSLVVSSMCPDWGWNPQPWRFGTVL